VETTTLLEIDDGIQLTDEVLDAEERAAESKRRAAHKRDQ